MGKIISLDQIIIETVLAILKSILLSSITTIAFKKCKKVNAAHVLSTFL